MYSMADLTLEIERLTVIATTVCNLHCKLCCNLMPRFKKPCHESVEDLIRDTDGFFALIDHIKYFHYVGGEVFTRKDMAPVYEHCLKYRDQFEVLRLITNATLLPCEADLAVLRKYGKQLEIQISDYGILSKVDQLTELLDKNDIFYTVKTYHGDDQHFGGWTDNTKFEDLGLRGAELESHFFKCDNRRIDCFHAYRGKMYGCPPMWCTHALDIVEPNREDYIDLYDENMSREEKRRIISNFGTKPYVLCHRCVPYSEGERFPAAEQI